MEKQPIMPFSQLMRVLSGTVASVQTDILDCPPSESRKRRFATLIGVLLLALSAGTVRAAISASERTVLLHLYTSSNGAAWTTTTNWNGAAGTECTWYGVTCDGGGNTVTGIDLHSNNLTGSLPGDLDSLTNLASFNAANNRLTGSISPLTGLTKLATFLINDNQLTGSIPPLTGLTALRYFQVNGNRLTGPIPVLMGLTSLNTFAADTNRLTGTIPDLSGLTNLWLFGVAVNQLTGSIPSLAGLTNLNQFVAWNNQLTGSIPPLTGLTNLGVFAVERNQLTGSIPSLAGLSNLDTFYVGDNQLTGVIPDLSGLPNLRQFDVGGNQLTGDVPPVPTNWLVLVHDSRLCPNFLNPRPDPAWDIATMTSPWYANCIAPPAPYVPIPTLSDNALLWLGVVVLALGFGALRARGSGAPKH